MIIIATVKHPWKAERKHCDWLDQTENVTIGIRYTAMRSCQKKEEGYTCFEKSFPVFLAALKCLNKKAWFDKLNHCRWYLTEQALQYVRSKRENAICFSLAWWIGWLFLFAFFISLNVGSEVQEPILRSSHCSRLSQPRQCNQCTKG